jgi:hypothetical protein
MLNLIVVRNIFRKSYVFLLFPALIGFVSVAAFVHLILPRPLDLYADQRSEKLAILARWQGRDSAAFFGSSHVHNGFDPRAFDEEMADSAEPTTSLNLAVEGGSQTEQLALAEEYLKSLDAKTLSRNKKQCFILLEFNAGTNFRSQYLFHPRSINIYSVNMIPVVLRFADNTVNITQRIGRILYSLGSAFLYYNNVGMLSNVIFSPPLKADTVARETIDDRRGFLSEPPNIDELPKVAAAIASRPERPVVRKTKVSEGYLYLLNKLAQSSPTRNVQFIYVVTPKINSLFSFESYPQSIPGPYGTVPILNLSDPQRFPGLYNKGLWIDKTHLNERGAKAFSRLLADEIKGWYLRHGVPKPCRAA